MIYVHVTTSGKLKKPAATFRIAAGSLNLLCFLLGRQHIVFKLRRSALPGKGVAVGKGEIEKITSAHHDLGYYRHEVKYLSRLFLVRMQSIPAQRRHGEKRIRAVSLRLCAFCGNAFSFECRPDEAGNIKPVSCFS